MTEPLGPPPGFYSLKTAARYLSLAPRTLRRYLRDPAHPVPYYRLGQRLLFKPAELDAWMAQFKQASRPVDEVAWRVLETMGARRAVDVPKRFG